MERVRKLDEFKVVAVNCFGTEENGPSDAAGVPFPLFLLGVPAGLVVEYFFRLGNTLQTLFLDMSTPCDYNKTAQSPHGIRSVSKVRGGAFNFSLRTRSNFLSIKTQITWRSLPSSFFPAKLVSTQRLINPVSKMKLNHSLDDYCHSTLGLKHRCGC